MSLGLGLGLVAGLCGAVRAASMRFDAIYISDLGLRYIRHERRCCRTTLSLHAGLGYGIDNLECTHGE